MSNCPFCESAVKNVIQFSNPMYVVDCLTCGRFYISPAGFDDPLPKGILPGKISAWTRQESEAGRVADVTDEMLLNPPKIFDGLSVESKIIRALQTIAQRFPIPGTHSTWDQNDWPLLCDSGVDECRWIFQSLSAQEFITNEVSVVYDGNFKAHVTLTAKAWAELESAKTKYQQHNLCFVAMRFLPELAPLFAAMERACHRAGYECKRVDTDPHADHIDNRLIDMLNRCRFVIADFTEDSRNVYFEAGYALGLSKKVIWARRAAQGVAFDTKQFNFIDWNDHDAATFESALETCIGAVVGRLAPMEPKPDAEENRLRNAPPPTSNITITSTGQITIPVEIRNALKLSAGDKIAFEETQPGEFAIKSAAPTSAIVAMNAAIEDRI